MDQWTAALCGAGAMVILRGGAAGSLEAALVLVAGFYGVHRAVRSGLSKVLIGFPVVVWLVGHLWDFAPEQLVEAIAPASSVLRSAPAGLSSTLLLVALILMVIGARARLGTALSTVSLGALGIALLLGLVPSRPLQEAPGSLSLLVLATDRGWAIVARALGAACMLLVGVGPLFAPPLPGRGGAIAGAVGALLLSAATAGIPLRVARDSDGALFAFGLVWLVASVLLAIGLGAIARAGAKPAGWIGLGLVVLSLVGVLPSFGVHGSTDANGYAFVMAIPFALLGVAIAMFGWNGAPFETARKMLGAVLLAGFAGGALAWVATFLALVRVTRTREPFALARLTTEPLAIHGLVVFAVLLLHLASPPTAHGKTS